MSEQIVHSRPLNAGRWAFLVVGILGIATLLVGLWGVGDRTHFFRAYLFGWMACLSFALGGLSVLMLHNATGGHWGRALRVVCERAALTVPLLAVLFVPVFFGLRELFPWADPSEVAKDDALQHRLPYLNPTFFILRAVAYFVIWSVLAFVLMAWQRRFDKTGDPGLRGRIRGFSCAGLIIYTICMTQAGFDWLLSRDVEFFSTAFGLVVTTGQTLAGMAFAIVVTSLAAKREQRRSILAASANRGILNDMGNIVLVMVILWTYVTFMEFLVIWMGNSQEDNAWYLQRGLSKGNPWGWVGLVLILWHFFIPFYLLLFRSAKQYVPALVAIAWVLASGDLLNTYWMVVPSGVDREPQFDFHWMYLAALVGLGGLWVSSVLWLMPREWRLNSMMVHPEEDAEAASD